MDICLVIFGSLLALFLTSQSYAFDGIAQTALLHGVKKIRLNRLDSSRKSKKYGVGNFLVIFSLILTILPTSSQPLKMAAIVHAGAPLSLE